MPGLTEATIRAGRADDLAEIVAVAWANEATTGDPPSGFGPYYAHLLAGGVVAVAEGRTGIVGFAGAVDTGRSRHLADVFVRPEVHGQGIGRRVVEAVLVDRYPRTTFSSDDPRALPTYVRAGMTVLWPNLYVAGDPARLPDLAPGHEVRDAPLDEVVAIEERWTGADRSRVLPYWRELPDSRPFLVTQRGRVVACGQTRRRLSEQGHWMNRATVAPEADPLPALLAAFRAGARGTSLLGGCFLGPSPMVRALLDAGWRIVDRDVYQASDPTLVDPMREVMNTGFL